MTELNSEVVTDIGEMAGGVGSELTAKASEGIDWKKHAKSAAICLGVIGLGALGYAAYKHFWGSSESEVVEDEDEDEVAVPKRVRNRVSRSQSTPVAAKRVRSKKPAAVSTRITAETQPDN